MARGEVNISQVQQDLRKGLLEEGLMVPENNLIPSNLEESVRNDDSLGFGCGFSQMEKEASE